MFFEHNIESISVYLRLLQNLLNAIRNWWEPTKHMETVWNIYKGKYDHSRIPELIIPYLRTLIALQERISYSLHERKNDRAQLKLERDNKSPNGNFKTCSDARRLLCKHSTGSDWYTSPITVPKYRIYGNTSCRKNNSIYNLLVFLIFFLKTIVIENNNFVLILQNMLLPLPQLLKGCAMPLSAIEFCKIASWSCYEQRFQHNMIWNLIHAIIKWNTSDRFILFQNINR